MLSKPLLVGASVLIVEVLSAVKSFSMDTQFVPFSDVKPPSRGWLFLKLNTLSFPIFLTTNAQFFLNN